MNYARFLQVADRYQIRMFDEWTRNRVIKDIDEMFHDWYSREWVCRDLKATEEEYERYSTAKRSAVVNKLTGDVAIFEPPKPTSNNVVDCPNCGVRLGLQEVKR